MSKRDIAALVRKYLSNERIEDTYFVVNEDDVLTSEDWIRVLVRPSRLPKRLSPMYGLLTDITQEIREKEGVNLFLISGDPLVEDEELVTA